MRLPSNMLPQCAT